MISDLDRLVPKVANERTCFTSCASTFKSTGLFTRLKRTLKPLLRQKDDYTPQVR